MRQLALVVVLLLSSPAWPQTQSSNKDAAAPSNVEMTAMYLADQSARDHPAAINWPALEAADKVRRQRAQALLAGGLLKSKDDYYHAAYIFQHGDTPDDCLKAHALAMVALSLGKTAAVRIAAASLDRYLQRMGQPQVYGTQFLHPPGERWTQEPYHRDLLPDAVRVASGVKPLADQEAQRRQWERDLP